MQIIGLHGPARAGKDTIADYLVSRYGFVKFAFSDALYAEVAAAYALPDESLLRNDATKDSQLERMSLGRCNDPDFKEMARQMIMDSAGFVFPNEVGLSPRWVLQKWGTEFRREQDPEYWIKKADLWMEAYIGTLATEITQEMRDAWINERILHTPDSQRPDFEVMADGVGIIVGEKEYADHPGVAVSGVRFDNEYEWLKRYNGTLWHVTRPSDRIALSSHVSETAFPLRTGDKLIQNNSTVERLNTGVALALQGNDIVNTAEE